MALLPPILGVRAGGDGAMEQGWVNVVARAAGAEQAGSIRMHTPTKPLSVLKVLGYFRKVGASLAVTH